MTARWFDKLGVRDASDAVSPPETDRTFVRALPLILAAVVALMLATPGLRRSLRLLGLLPSEWDSGGAFWVSSLVVLVPAILVMLGMVAVLARWSVASTGWYGAAVVGLLASAPLAILGIWELWELWDLGQKIGTLVGLILLIAIVVAVVEYMFSVRGLLATIVIIGGIHGYMWLQTENAHPCRAAQVRLTREHGPTAFTVGLGAFGTLFAGREYQPKTEAERKLMQKLETVDRFGVFGCYLPAVLGWWAVPPR